MPTPTPISKALQGLLEQQKRDAERQRQEHRRDEMRSNQQWQQRQQWQRQEQYAQRESLRLTQQSTKQMLKQHASLGLPGSVMMQLVKQDRALWSKLNQQQRKVLENAATRGATGGELYRLLQLQQRKERHHQQQLQQQPRLAERLQAGEMRGHLRGAHRAQAAGLADQHGQARAEVREKDRQEKLEYREWKKADKEAANELRKLVRIEEQRKTREDREQHQVMRLRYGAALKQQKEEERTKQRQQKERQREAEKQAEYNRLPNRLRRGAAVASGVTSVATAGMHWAGQSMAVAQTPYMSQAAKSEQMMRSIPVVGEMVGALFDFAKNLNDTTLALHRMRGVAALSGIYARSQAHIETTQHASEYTIAQQRNLASSLQGGFGGGRIGATGIVAMRHFGASLVGMAKKRNTWEGERAYQRAALRFGAHLAVERADAEVEAARQTYAHASGRRAASQGIMGAYEQAVARTERNADTAAGRVGRIAQIFGGDSQKAYFKSLEEHVKTLNAAAAHQAVLEGDINRERQAGVTLAEKERQLAQARLGLTRAERDILRQKEQKMSQGATNIALMPAWRRGMAMQSLRTALQAKDLGMLPPFMLQMAQSLAPETIRRKAEQQGLGMREYKELQKIGEIDKGDLNAIRKRETELSVKLDITPQINEKVLAEAVARAVEASLKHVIKAAKVKAELESKKWLAGQMTASASR
ncbi:MAG TPA: hypothetical protein VMG10_27395 [Gemmataceae bacterium]|nr:hypothetical protein [Gemmataceae bacterium]